MHKVHGDALYKPKKLDGLKCSAHLKTIVGEKLLEHFGCENTKHKLWIRYTLEGGGTMKGSFLNMMIRKNAPFSIT